MRRLLAMLTISAVIAACTALFCLPAIRETQVLLCRMLFHMPVENTMFISPNPFDPVPKLWRSNGFQQRLRSDQGRCPDGYLLSRCGWISPEDFPSAGQWAAHPLARWAVMDAAGRVQRLQASTLPADAADNAKFASSSFVRNLLATIRMLQADAPYDGGLWLAEGVVLFQCGDFDGGYACVRGAISREHWPTSRLSYFVHARSMLQAEGFPRLEATEVAMEHSWIDPQRALLGRAADALVRRAVSAVRTGDDWLVEDLFNALTALGQVVRPVLDPSLGWDVPGSSTFEELTAAMAERLGCEAPVFKQCSSYEALASIRRQIFVDYFELLDRREVSQRFFQEDALQVAWRTKLGLGCCGLMAHRWSGLHRAGLAGLLAVLLMGLLLSGILAELPFLIAPPVRLGSQDLFPAGFILVLLIVFAMMVGILFCALEAICGQPSLRIKGWTLLPGSYALVVLCSALAFAVAAFRRLVVWHPIWYRGAWLILFLLYLPAVWYASQARHAALERLSFPFF